MASIDGYDPRWGEVTADLLTKDFRLIQRAKGHRFSSDDVITAWVAATTCPRAARVLDLGCGIGSVLLHLAWSLPETTLVGIEAQEVSFALLSENVRRNGVADRVTIHHGDLRDELGHLGGPFDLITGTPPYFPPGTALDSVDTQRAFARTEHRGGVDDYVIAGSRVLDERGTLVLCGDARTEPRVEAAARASGLHIVARTGIVARAPKPPLFCVWTLMRQPGTRAESEIVLRDAGGERTRDADILRAFSGFAVK